MAALLGAGIVAEKLPGKEGMVSLQVAEAQFSPAISLMNAEGLPREKYARMGDVFRKEGLISSPLEERARYLWALSQELSATLSQIDNVIKARVHVVLPERSSGSDPAMPSSAAVFIKYKTGFNHEDVIPQVKRLVASSIPGLTLEKVTVVMLPAVMPTDPNPAAEAGIPKVFSQTSNSPGKITNASSVAKEHRLWIWAGCTALLVSLSAIAGLAWRKWGHVVQQKETSGSIGTGNPPSASGTAAVMREQPGNSET